MAALGAAWWLPSDGLSAEERRLVGTWRLRRAPVGQEATWEFGADRRWQYRSPLPPAGWGGEQVARWSVPRGELQIDSETSPIRRALRPLARLVGVRFGPVNTYALSSLTDDELVVSPDGTPVTWSRTGAE